MIFGVAELRDGVVRVLSQGFLHTDLTRKVSRWQALRVLERPEIAFPPVDHA